MRKAAESVVDGFLESDIGDDRSELRFLAERARHPEPEPWGFGGNTCHVTVDRDEVLVENDFTGEQATISRTDFLRILDEYAQGV